MTVSELKDKRGKAISDGRAILDFAAGEKRSINAEEKVQYEAFLADAVRIGEDIAIEERQISLERDLVAEKLKNLDSKEHRQQKPGEEQRMAAFRKLILEGQANLTGEEVRALTAGQDTQGGFLVTPQEFVQELIVAVKNQVFMRGLAKVIPLNGPTSCGVPTLDSDVGDADWTPEVKIVTEDTNLAFGKRELMPHPLSKLVKISNKLLRSAALNPESIVMDRMAYKFGVSMEKGYLSGDGVQKPLGVFTASTDGISTARDVAQAAGNTTTITADGLIAAKYALKAQYLQKSQWIFHRDMLKQVASLKTGDGYYLFELSDKADVPDTLLGRPLLMSEFAPNTLAASAYVGILGDFSYYWIADSLALQFMRLNELFSLNNQVGFIGRMESDGAPVLGEAFSRVQLSAN